MRTPDSVLSPWRTNSFTVIFEDGTEPKFTGVDVKYSLDELHKNGDIVELGPSQSITVTHDLDGVYLFDQTGTYSIIPSTSFIVLSASSTSSDIIFETTNATLDLSNMAGNVTLVGFSSLKRLAITGGQPENPSIRRRAATFENCQPSQEPTVRAALNHAETYIEKAIV